MKNLKKKSSILSIVLLAFLMIVSSCNLFAQKKKTPDFSKFIILIETTDNGTIKLTCKDGCAWKELSFNMMNNDSIQAIDQYGMTTKNESDNSSFIFTIQHTKQGIKLEGIKGTSWTKLNFSCNGNCYQAIDQNGMTE